MFSYIAAAAAKLLQSCPTLCDPIDGSPPGSSVPGILQARMLEWVAISFPNSYIGVCIYLQLSYPLDELTPLSLHSDVICLFWLKAISSDINIVISLLVIIYMEYLFPSLHFQASCVIKAKLSLLEGPNCWSPRAGTGVHHHAHFTLLPPREDDSAVLPGFGVGWRVKCEVWNCLTSLLHCIFSYLFYPGSAICHLNP